MAGSNGSASSGLNAKQTVIDGLPVTVEALLGVAEVTVGEINALEVGQAFTLDTKLGDLVTLRVNGIAIAKGELVSVGDNFGIRIQSLADAS